MTEPYTIDYLVNKFYEEYNQTAQPDQKISLTKPSVMIQNKRTCITNFEDICQKMNRSLDHVKTYFDKELSITSSLNANNNLIIVGIFHENKIMSILKQYIDNYLLCHQCKSCLTEIIKENRLQFIKCNKCFSKRSI